MIRLGWIYVAVSLSLGTSMVLTTCHLEPTSIGEVLGIYGIAFLWPLWLVAILARLLWSALL